MAKNQMRINYRTNGEDRVKIYQNHKDEVKDEYTTTPANWAQNNVFLIECLLVLWILTSLASLCAWLPKDATTT